MCVCLRVVRGEVNRFHPPFLFFRRGVEKLNRNDAKGYIVVQYTLYFSHLLFFFFEIDFYFLAIVGYILGRLLLSRKIFIVENFFLLPYTTPVMYSIYLLRDVS